MFYHFEELEVTLVIPKSCKNEIIFLFFYKMCSFSQKSEKITAKWG